MNRALETTRTDAGVAAGVLLVVLGWVVPLGMPWLTLVYMFDGALVLSASFVIFLAVVTAWTVLWSRGRKWAWLCGAPAAALLVPAIAGMLRSVFGSTPATPETSDPLFGSAVVLNFALTGVAVLAFAIWLGFTQGERGPAPQFEGQEAPLQKAANTRPVGVLSVVLAWVVLGYLVRANENGSAWDGSASLALLGLALCVAGCLFWVLRGVQAVLTSTRSKVDTLIALLVGGTGILWLIVVLALVLGGHSG